MKRLLIIISIISLCCLCACGTGQTGKDTDMPAINCETGKWNYVVSADGGYYLMSNGLFAFWDGDLKHKATTICSRPGCDHELPKCPAHIPVGSDRKKMFYVDGSLYVFAGWKERHPVTQAVGYPLWKVATDGSSKEMALVVRECPEIYTIFQNVVYYESREEDEDGKTICSVWSIPLAGGEEEQIFQSGYQAGGLYMLQGIGDILYFKEYGMDLSLDLTDPEIDLGSLEEMENLYAYNPKTGELERNPLPVKEGWSPILRNIYEGRLYYTLWKDQYENEMWSRPIDGEGEAVLLGHMPIYVNAADSDYMYTTWMDNEEKNINELIIYDYEGNVKQEIQLGPSDHLDLVPANENYVFGYYVETTSEEEGTYEDAVVLLEREKIADGTAEMITLFRNETGQE